MSKKSGGARKIGRNRKSPSMKRYVLENRLMKNKLRKLIKNNGLVLNSKNYEERKQFYVSKHSTFLKYCKS